MMPTSPPRHTPAGHRTREQYRRDLDRQRGTPAQRGYDAAWFKASKAFLAAHPWCVCCGKPATVVDHIRPHRGDRALFWDRTNWQPMTKPCHDRKTATVDRSAGRGSLQT
jgi:5-methylcytosine-specific restriction protein A